MSLLAILFLSFGLFFSPFYFWSSGIPQISHLLLLSSGLVIFSNNIIKSAGNIIYPLFCFSVCSVLINLGNGFFYQRTEFLFPVLQLVFGLLVFVSTILCLQALKTPNVLLAMLGSAVSIQLALYLGGFGREFFGRYMGYFNDPNQMAFWAACMTAIFIVSTHGSKSKWQRAGLFFLILASMALGLITFSRSYLLGLMLSFFYLLINRRVTGFMIFFCIILLILYVSSADYFQGSRLAEVSILDELKYRGITRVMEYPQLLLLGSGQGFHERFTADFAFGHVGTEVHSTPMAILSYYGFVPTCFLALFLLNIWRSLVLSSRIALLLLIGFSMTTFVFRTPIFWVTLAYITFSIRNFGVKT